MNKYLIVYSIINFRYYSWFNLFLYLFFKKNKNNTNYNFDDVKDVSIELNNYYKEIKNLKNERDILVENEFYKTTDINELFKKKTQIENQINANDNSEEEFRKIKIKYSILLDESIKLEEEINKLKEKENKINEENKIIASQTDHILKKVFPELSISLFNEKDVEDIVIKKDGVPFKYLNYAAKQNIVFQFNEKLNSNQIIPFFLIDHAESINKIYKPNNNQTIICKVSNDSGLILNGKNIY